MLYILRNCSIQIQATIWIEKESTEGKIVSYEETEVCHYLDKT